MQWRPIETAPKDGADILIGFDSASVWVVHVAWWRDSSDEGFSECGFDQSDVGWWSYVKGAVTQEQLNGYRTPTHWMPLPPPPKSEG